MSDTMLDAYSRENENQQPHLHTCTLVVGDGTARVEFRNGRAKVPASIAALVAKHPHIDIPALATASADAAEDELEAPVAPPAPKRELTEEQRAAQIKAARDYLKQEGILEDEADSPADPPADPVTRPGFDAATGDGQPRCQAAKGDGTQCANPATSGSACGFAKHQEQLVDKDAE